MTVGFQYHYDCHREGNIIVDVIVAPDQYTPLDLILKHLQIEYTNVNNFSLLADNTAPLEYDQRPVHILLEC